MIAYREINEVEPHGSTGRHAGGSLANDLGYIVGGHRPGPNALVAGYQPVADRVFDALLALPTLPWLRGTLYLVRIEALGGGLAAGDAEALSDVQFDRTLILPLRAASPGSIDVTAECYRRVLGLCAELGMIQGRGLYQVSPRIP